MDDELKANLEKIAEIRRNDIGWQESMFLVVNKSVLATLSKDDYMVMTNDEVLINLVTQLVYKYGEEKTNQWLKGHITEWDIKN
jgi:hypothetical protein